VFATYVNGVGIPLGNALHGNTHVEELHLQLCRESVNSPDDDNEGIENIALILQYLRDGAALRMLCIYGGSLQYTSAHVQAIAQRENSDLERCDRNSAFGDDRLVAN
jgi:hypothetical protein